MTWMLYGAYGYTGRLVAAVAAERGEMPLLAGRDEGRLRTLAEVLQLDHRAVGLDDPGALDEALSGVDVVAHCAGPFSATALPLVEACLRTGTHYLDVTGEFEVIDAVLARHEEARRASVTLVPASGFDVVPSDCLAALLAAALPGAARLAIAVRLDGGPSAGTAATAVESLDRPPLARLGGSLVQTPPELRRRTVAFADGRRDAVALPLADLATAWRSTGIDDVVVYGAVPAAVRAMTGVPMAARRLAANRLSRRLLQRMARRLPGPSPATRSGTRSMVWAEVADRSGQVLEGTVSGPNAYDLTADAVVRIAGLLEKGAGEPGAWTPSQAWGPEFVRQLDDVEVRVPA